MKKNNKETVLHIIVIGCIFILGIIGGCFLFAIVESNQMKDYDLYNCIYVNAAQNNFNQNPIMIEKIQNECVCFRSFNYTNLLEKNCSNTIIEIKQRPISERAWIFRDDNVTCHSDGCNMICCDTGGECTTTLKYCPKIR